MKRIFTGAFALLLVCSLAAPTFASTVQVIGNTYVSGSSSTSSFTTIHSMPYYKIWTSNTGSTVLNRILSGSSTSMTIVGITAGRSYTEYNESNSTPQTWSIRYTGGTGVYAVRVGSTITELANAGNG